MKDNPYGKQLVALNSTANSFATNLLSPSFELSTVKALIKSKSKTDNQYAPPYPKAKKGLIDLPRELLLNILKCELSLWDLDAMSKISKTFRRVMYV
jgi:hypothetical protein